MHRCTDAQITIFKNRSLVVAGILLLAGCGGGGGNSGASQSTLDNAAIMPETRMAARTFAGATPVSGSVTQTSNVDATGITQDSIAAEATYDGDSLSIDIEHTAADNTRTTIGTSDIVLSSETVTATNTGTDVKLRTLEKSVDGGDVYVAAYTTRVNAADTDYLVGGVWLFVPDSEDVNDVQIGAFADGPDANLTPLTYLQTPANAMYEGDAAGIYLGVDDGEGYGGDFGADVTLTAAFGASPTVSGTVHTFMVRGINEDSFSPLSVTLMLEDAPITAANGGFFTGDSSGSLPANDGDGTYTYTGKWGGQFYGTQAGTVGGTFGGSGARSTDQNDVEYFVGTFFAEKQ